MTSVHVDIATRFLGAQEDIYIIRPGEKFAFYNVFVARNVVFLDFPDLQLNLAGPKPKRQALREAVVRSMRIQDWHGLGRPPPGPSRDPQDYIGAANGRRIGRYVAAIERLYFDLPAGTIIVVPGPGYFSDTLIGELVGAPTTIGGVYEGEQVPARRVRWIGQRSKARFSGALRERLQKPTLMMAVERGLRKEILEAAFDQYFIGDTYSARLKTTKGEFSTLDDYNIQTFLNYIAGILVAVEVGGDGGTIDFPAALSLLSGRRDLIPELTSNINSPGDLRLFSLRVNPLVAVAFLAIALATPAGSKPDDIQVSNSAVAGGDPCALEVQEHALNAIKMMDLDTWNVLCEGVRNANDQAGVSTSIKVVPDDADQ